MTRRTKLEWLLGALLLSRVAWAPPTLSQPLPVPVPVADADPPAAAATDPSDRGDAGPGDEADADAPALAAGADDAAGKAEADAPMGFLEFLDPEGVPVALLVFVLAFVALRATERVSERLSEKLVAKRLLIKQTNTLIAFAVYLVATMIAASAVLELSAQAVFALSGTIAVTLGFAFQDVAASFLAGIPILINKPFQVGDRISFGGFYGEVKEIGLRTVRLVTLDDNLVTIPSNSFLTAPVASANAGELDCMVVMTYWTTPAADHARARQIIHDAVMASKYLYLGKPFGVLVATRLSDTGRMAIEYTAKAYVYDALHEKAFASDVTERVLTAFREEGIEMPV